MMASLETNDLTAEHGESEAGAAHDLAALFEQVCRQHGDRVAVSMGPQSCQKQIRYAELNARANGIAAALLARGAGRGTIVAILMERSIEMIAAMLGVIKAGAAYLPIDPGYPAARIVETLQDASATLVLTSRDLQSRYDAVPAALMIPGALMIVEELAHAASEMIVMEAAPDDPAYVIYTSGSTGKPKGVVVSHRNVARLLSATEPWFHFNVQDVWTMFHSFAFDFSVWEIWGCLLTGGRLVIVPFSVSRSPEDFYRLLAEEGVTVLNQTPSAFSLLMQAEVRVGMLPLSLRYVIFGGEALNFKALSPWFQRHGDAAPKLINMYGITETTVHVTYREICATDAEHETESLIGVAIADLRLYLLDANLLPVADGETGEMCIGGAGVAWGYLNRPELTRERFLPDPFGEDGARMYRSGDLARRRADGELVYLGRADRQVKINGFRIELGEVEAALLACPGIRHACVIDLADEQGSQRLAAYYVADDAHLDQSGVSRYMATHLPAHMRPAFYVPIATLPLNANGKIDRAALPDPSQQRSNAVVAGNGDPMSRIAAVWQRVLRRNEIGVDDNFFDIGGSSLLLIAARTALEQEFARSIPITWMFEATTVRTLSARLGAAAQQAAPQAVTAMSDNARQQRNSFARARALRSVTK